jgi:hypothetical protein
MGNKQTAVDWLIEQIIKYELVPKGTNKDNVLFHKAKQIEKANIIKARVDGDEHHTFNSQMREEYAEDYYKENYEE